MVNATLVDAVIVLAREAGRAVMAHYGSPVGVEAKDDSSPITLADRVVLMSSRPGRIKSVGRFI